MTNGVGVGAGDGSVIQIAGDPEGKRTAAADPGIVTELRLA